MEKILEEVLRVTRNYQVTMPAAIGSKEEIDEGDISKVVYDEREGLSRSFR